MDYIPIKLHIVRLYIYMYQGYYVAIYILYKVVNEYTYIYIHSTHYIYAYIPIRWALLSRSVFQWSDISLHEKKWIK